MKGRETGQAAVFVIGMAMLTMAVAGVAVDGTRAFLYRRTLQNAADSASLAGASALDVSLFYGSGGRDVAVDAAAARAAAYRSLAVRRLGARAAVSVVDGRVRVELRGNVPATLLAVVGIDAIPVAVEAFARPVTGDAPSAGAILQK